MEVWLLEINWGYSVIMALYLRVENTDIWIHDYGYDTERIKVVDWSEEFWIKADKEYRLTKIGQYCDYST